MSSDARVLLIGLGTTTRSALEALLPHYDVCGLVRPTGDSVADLARQAKVAVFPECGPEELERVVCELRPDAVVVSSYDRILAPQVLTHCPFINVHYAPLPRYRGRATVNWAIINGEPETAMTIHCLEPELDAGGILAQVSVPIGPRATVAGLYEELNEHQRLALPAAVDRRLQGDRGLPQDESLSTYCCSRVPADGEIDWSDSVDSVDRLIRSLGGPFPPAFTYLGLSRINVLRAFPALDAHHFEGRVPGRVVRVDRRSGFVDVLTGDGVLRIEAVSSDGGEEVPPAVLVRSVRDTLGLSTTSLLARLEALENRIPRVATTGGVAR